VTPRKTREKPERVGATRDVEGRRAPKKATGAKKFIWGGLTKKHSNKEVECAGFEKDWGTGRWGGKHSPESVGQGKGDLGAGCKRSYPEHTQGGRPKNPELDVKKRSRKETRKKGGGHYWGREPCRGIQNCCRCGGNEHRKNLIKNGEQCGGKGFKKKSRQILVKGP